MPEPVIRLEKVGKRYRIGKERYHSLREDLTHLFRKKKKETIWALKDISFEVKRGEVLGIIGPNGAGKTTLLKLLAGITLPTEGKISIKGRVASLIEIGAGIHPELSGRENISLYGSIMGLKKREIDKKFDEIVDFAGIEKFLDTPVKYYSSGMQMRLGFSVAAHIQPDILLVDEVLAVGDIAFQKKCLGKMDGVAKSGRTVLFVSHNMGAISRLCGSVYLLDQGHIMLNGDAASIVNAYYRMNTAFNGVFRESRVVPEGRIGFLKWSLDSPLTGDPYKCYTREQCTFRFKLLARRIVKEANFGIIIWSDDGSLIWSMRSLDNGGQYISINEGLYEVRFSILSLPLKSGSYQIYVTANDREEGTLDEWYAQPKLVVSPKDESGLPRQFQGILNISGKFEISSL